MVDKLQIEKGIPIPSRKRYPWDEMEVGDSFFIPNGKAGGSGLHAAAKRYANITITVRKAVENGIEGARIWRRE